MVGISKPDKIEVSLQEFDENERKLTSENYYDDMLRNALREY